MKKIAKYCSACRKSFTENFSFCPNCAAALFDNEVPPIEPYNLTFVEEKGNPKRRMFLFGATILVLGGAVCGLVGSIYNAQITVDALDDSLSYLANINDGDPYKLDEPDVPKNKKPDGGTGGNKDKNPVSNGVLASQSEKPLIAPSVTMTKVTDPTIKIRMETKGVIERKPTDQPYGNPNSKYDILSDGDGKNGGQGNGPDRGQGPGKGPGSGPGDEPGNEPGRIIAKATPKNTPEIDSKPPELKPTPTGITVGMKILAKPRAIYTNEARKNQRAGTVILRVTFMANGSIGNVAVVNGLPDGLTENAIAAAKGIQFEPAKRNGVPQTVTRQVEYTYTLY